MQSKLNEKVGMTDNQADKLVVEKWEILSSIDYQKYKDRDIYYILKQELPEKNYQLDGCCAWCDKHSYTDGCLDICPLMKINNCCDYIGSVYKKWSGNLSQKTARAMLRLVKKAIKKVRRI